MNFFKNNKRFTFALLLLLLGIIWQINYKYFSIGDIILNKLNLPIYSETTYGDHYTIYYSLIFYVLALIVSNKKDKKFYNLALNIILIILIILYIAYIVNLL